DDPEKNAVLCSCECDPPSSPVAIPWKNFIATGADDAREGKIDGNQLALGQSTVGLRFQKLGVPPLATIKSAFIQFTPAASSSGTTVLQVHRVDDPNAPPFGPPLRDLDTLSLVAGNVDWPVGPWNVQDDKPDFKPELTPNLASQLQVIVNKAGYTPNSAVAFIITGSGNRAAAAFESNSSAAFLTVEYVPRKANHHFLTCSTPPHPP